MSMYCAWIGDIELPVNTKTEYNVLSKHNDAGFIRLLTSFDLKKVEDLSGIPFENVKFDYEVYSKAENFGKSVFPDDRHQGAPQIYEGAEDLGKSVFSDDSNELYTTASIETFAQAEHLITDKDGLIHFTNQDIATYHLTETKTLPGYVRDTKTHVIKVMPETTVENNNLVWKTYISVDGVRQTDNLYTLKNTSETTNLTVTKKWDDANDQDGIRQNAVITLKGTVTLPDGKTEAVPLQKAYTALFKATDTYLSYTFRSIPAYYKGQTIQYTVIENPMDGYTATVGATTGSADKGYAITVTNKHVPQFDDFTVVKVWDDSNNIDGMRPDSVTIHLNGSDGSSTEATLSNAKDWKYIFKHNLITITNTHAPEKLDLIVNVVWNDANNQDGYRPDAATIHMSGTDGTQDAKDFTKDSSWSSIVFKDLDHYKDGNEIKYTVAEDEIPQYTTSIAVNGNVVTVTNTHIPEITLRNISVVWEDNNDQDGLRPDTVSVKLKGNDKFIDSSELNEDVEWKHSFTKLPVRENGNEISYTAEENEIPGYTTSIEKTDTGYVFTNTHIPETVTVTVDKVWKDAENQDGLRPDAIHIRLISNNIEKDAYLDAESDWHLDFEGLPKYRDHGILNEYSVQEVDVDGYTSTVTTKDGYAFTIENDHVPAVIDIPITEEWIDDNDCDGLRPDSHTVILVDGTNVIEEVVLDKNNGYGVVLKNMPKYKNGVEINYQIKDFKVDGYTTNIIKSDSVKDFNITNTHVPEMVTVTVTEGWHDQSDYDKIRPEKVTLTLTGSDGNVYEKTVTKDTWTTAFSDLPKNSKGEQIIYTLTQEGIKGYKTTITDNETGTIAVINTHEPVKTITVTVTWNDENNKDNIRPDKVTVKLANGTTAVSTKEINNDSWKHVFENIIVFNGDGKASYTVTQDAVNGYTTEIKASDDGNTIEIINTYVPVAPPKEEPKQEETATPATPAPVVEIKTEPTTTVIETPNKQTGISFMDGLFG